MPILRTMSEKTVTNAGKRRYNRLSIQEKQQVARRLAEGESIEALAVEFQVHFNTIGNIRKAFHKVPRLQR